MSTTPQRQHNVQQHPLGSPPSSGPPSSSVGVNSPGGGGGGTSGGVQLPSSAVPILKVMRLQSPELGQPSAGILGTRCLCGPSMALPDSFGVIHIGETFTAYLGAINPSPDLPVLRLTVAAQLQTPSRRWTLPSKLDASNEAGGVDVPPDGGGVDAIVSRSLEEVGQHILRVEVGYGGNKTLRKFYRFNVASPLHIRELTLRAGDASCFVSIAIENATAGTALTISNADFLPPEGLVADRIDHRVGVGDGDHHHGIVDTKGEKKEKKKWSAVELFEGCGRLDPGASFRYLFRVRADSRDAALRGIACGDELGKAVFTWRKAMGEAGRIASTSVLCPPSQPPGMTDADGGGGGAAAAASSSSNGSKFVVHGSGLSVDVASAAANKSAFRSTAAGGDRPGSVGLDEVLPVTVEPIDPPSTMKLAAPQEVQLLIVNHSEKTMNLQLQMRLAHMSGVVVCGSSFKNLGELPGSGGSHVVGVRLVPLVAGLFRAQGCFIVDLTTGREIPQPPLFNVFVDKTKDQ